MGKLYEQGIHRRVTPMANKHITVSPESSKYTLEQYQGVFHPSNL